MIGSVPHRVPSRASIAPAAPPSLDDAMRAVAAGDVSAVKALFVALGPAMLRAVRGVLGSGHPDVEDVLQESSFAVIRALPGFRGECTATHFACRVAVLTAMAARRKSRVREKWHYDLESPDLAPASASSTPTSMAAATRRRELLRTLCDELPDAQSEALAMQCVMGFSIDEIAVTTGAPVDTVRSRLRLAKQALRARVEADPILAEALETDS